MFSVAITLLLSTLVSGIALPSPKVVGSQPEPPIKRSALPTRWYHKRDHPVRELFKRADPLPTVGSPQWTALYPQGLPEANIPAAWQAALDTAVAAGKIPDIAPATTPDNGVTAVYDPSLNAGQEPICSAQFQCRAPGDIWDAPDGVIGLSVDDGPVNIDGASNALYDFLAANNQKVTHFMIGENILGAPDMFLRAFSELDNDIGCHTWTHRHMSLLTNQQLIADLGWTMQIIHDSTGGRIPRYWRPPYGDADNRVRAVAKEVFGLTTVVWNNDSNDWTMAATPPGTTLPQIQAEFTGWLNGNRTPGLIVLEHEITPDDVTAFKNMYPLIASATGGPWTALSISQMFDDEHVSGGNGNGWYLNSDNNTAPVEDMDILASGYAESLTETHTSSGTTTATASHTPTTTVHTGSAIRNVAGASGFALMIALVMSLVL